MSTFSIRSQCLTALCLVALLVGTSACSDPPKRNQKDEETRAEKSRRGLSEQEKTGQGMGSETEGDKYAGAEETTMKSDTYLLVRQTDFKNYARVHHGDPTESDTDTWNSRVKANKTVHRIMAGTKVRILGGLKKFNLKTGTTVRFIRVEVMDGSIKDDNGFPRRGNVPAESLGR